MKRFFTLLAGVLLATAASGQSALDYQVLQINAAGTGYNVWYLTAPATGSCFYTLNSGAGALTCTDSANFAQQPGDWSAASGPTRILNKPTLFSGAYADLTGKPTLGRLVAETTEKIDSFRVVKSTTVASGVAVFHLTADGTSGGTALFTEAFQDSVRLMVNDATASFQMSWAWSNSNKTLTVTANKLTTANILTGILGQTQANGSVVKLIVDGR